MCIKNSQIFLITCTLLLLIFIGNTIAYDYENNGQGPGSNNGNGQGPGSNNGNGQGPGSNNGNKPSNKPTSTPFNSTAPTSTPVNSTAPTSTPVNSTAPTSTPVNSTSPTPSPTTSTAPTSTPSTTEPTGTPNPTSGNTDPSIISEPIVKIYDHWDFEGSIFVYNKTDGYIQLPDEFFRNVQSFQSGIDVCFIKWYPREQYQIISGEYHKNYAALTNFGQRMDGLYAGTCSDVICPLSN